MYKIRKMYLHLKTVIKHKKEVCRLCFLAGIPVQGILHDFSKFSPIEFFESVKYCNGKESPIATCRRETGESKAWLHHKALNKHHWEYWVDDLSNGGKPVAMPYRYALEMAIDIIAANKTYNEDFWTPNKLRLYWNDHRKKIIVHKKTLEFLDSIIKNYILLGDVYLDPRNLKTAYNRIMRKQKQKIIFPKRKYIELSSNKK